MVMEKLEFYKTLFLEPPSTVAKEKKFIRRCHGDVHSSWLDFHLLNLQVENISLLRREKEVTLKAEAGDAARRISTISDSRAADMDLRLQQCMSDCDNLQLRVEDATQATGMCVCSWYFVLACLPSEGVRCLLPIPSVFFEPSMVSFVMF